MKLVFIVSRFPWPLVKGDKLRAYHQIKELSKHFDICLCALSDENVSKEGLTAMEKYCSEIHVFKLPKYRILLNLIYYFLFTKKPVQVGYFFNKKVERKMKNVINKFNPDHIYCQLIRTAEYAKGFQEIPKTLDYMDALSAGMERRSESASGMRKRLFTIEARRLKRYEHFIYNDFNSCTIISESDRNLIFQYNNEDIEIVPNGIDAEYFKTINSKKDFDLLFTGNMSYPPNIRTAIYLVQQIMPLVWKEKPSTKLLISGANPIGSVKSLQNEKVQVLGWVDDIRTSYGRCKIFVAPMIIGSGLQNKLLEAMAMKLPCITSELANKALGAENGVSILVGKSKEEYAAQIIELLENEDKAVKIAENGHSFAINSYNWSKSNLTLQKLLSKTNGSTSSTN